jgi:ABC-type multidrug transport system ATPase subunit
MQDDLLFEYFTVKEALTFAARLRLTITEEEQDKRVQDLLQELGLVSAQDTECGSVLRKRISGGERKRTAIGVELITDPSIIFLDEPTSGLDSFRATSIVRLLQNLAHKKGKTILATIHQPNSEAFSLFDRLYLMMDGYCVYQGDARDSVAFFAKHGHQLREKYNPADFFMKLLTINYPKEENDVRKIEEFTTAYKELVPALNDEAKKFPDLPKFEIEGVKRASLGTQFKMLFHRAGMGLKRDPLASRARMGQTVFMSLTIIILYNELREPGDTVEMRRQTVQSTAGMFFFVNLNIFMLAYMTTLQIFSMERLVIVREQANQMYDIIPYYFARTAVETPLFILSPLVYTAIFYFGVGLQQSAGHFFKLFLALAMVIQSALSYSYFLSAMISDGAIVLMVGPIVIFPFMLLGGFFTNSAGVQEWLKYVEKISPLHYGFEAAAWNEWGNEVTKEQCNSRIEDLDMINKCMPHVLGFHYSYWKCIVILALMNVLLRILSSVGFKLIIGKFTQ